MIRKPRVRVMPSDSAAHLETTRARQVAAGAVDLLGAAATRPGRPAAGYVTATLTATREQALGLIRQECGADECGPGRHTVVDLAESPGGAALVERDAERARRRGLPRRARRAARSRHRIASPLTT